MTSPLQPEEDRELRQQILSELQMLNILTAKRVGQQNNAWLALRNGLLAGMGGVVGAALLGALLISLLKPFEGLAPIRVALERLSKQESARPN